MSRTLHFNVFYFANVLHL